MRSSLTDDPAKANYSKANWIKAYKYTIWTVHLFLIGYLYYLLASTTPEATIEYFITIRNVAYLGYVGIIIFLILLVLTKAFRGHQKDHELGEFLSLTILALLFTNFSYSFALLLYRGTH